MDRHYLKKLSAVTEKKPIYRNLPIVMTMLIITAFFKVYIVAEIVILNNKDTIPESTAQKISVKFECRP